MSESLILEYLEARFTAGRRATYDPQQIAALCTDVPIIHLPIAIEAAITQLETRRIRRRPVDRWMLGGLLLQ